MCIANQHIREKSIPGENVLFPMRTRSEVVSTRISSPAPKKKNRGHTKGTGPFPRPEEREEKKNHEKICLSFFLLAGKGGEALSMRRAEGKNLRSKD